MKTKQKILATATDLFLTKGVDRVGVREIAEKAGVNLSLMNYYFQSKENLFNTIFDMLVKERALQVREILEKDAPIEQKIKEYTFAYIDLLIEQPILVSFVLSVIHRDPEKVKTMGSIIALYSSEKFCKQLKAEAEAGKIRLVDPEQLYISLLSLILFPLAIKDLIKASNSFSPEEYIKFINDRKIHISEMIINDLRL